MKTGVKVVLIAFITMAALVVFFFYKRNANIEKLNNALDRVAQKIAGRLTVEQAAGQIMVIHTQLDDLETFKTLTPGGVFMHPLNLHYHKNGISNTAKTNSLKKQLDSLYRQKNLPAPVLAVDQEGGYVSRMEFNDVGFPSMLALSHIENKTGRDDLPLLAGFYLCREIKKAGIDFNWAPVADLKYSDDNLAVHTRSFGYDIEQVSDSVEKYLSGNAAAGCISSVKHFPGHGDTSTDSHKGLPVIEKNETAVFEHDLVPFIKAIETGNSDTIMVGHLVFKNIDQLPVPLSEYWLKTILRKKLQFNGAIISDAMDMTATQEFKSKEPFAVATVKAGVDILLTGFKSIDELKQMHLALVTEAKKNKKFKIRLEQAATRFLRIKLKHGIIDNYLVEALRTSDIWATSLREEIELILKHTTAEENNAVSLTERMPQPAKASQFAAAAAITTVQQNLKLKSNNNIIYTDLDPAHELYTSLTENYKKVESFDDYKGDKKAVILITYNPIKFEDLSDRLKNTAQPYLLYTIRKPLPLKRFLNQFNPESTIISAMGKSHFSLQALVQAAVNRSIPQIDNYLEKSVDKP